MTDTIKELIAAGELASEGTWFNNGNEIKAPDYDVALLFDEEYGNVYWPDNAPDDWTGNELNHANLDFILKAANARPAIKAMLGESTRLREKLGEILTIAADADDDVIAELAREGLGA